MAAVVAILGASGIWWLVGKRDSSSTSVPTTTVRSTTAVTAYDSQLKELLPSGYGSNACQFIDPADYRSAIHGGVSHDSSPGGPVTARYSVFPIVTLNDQFREIFRMTSSGCRVQAAVPTSPVSVDDSSTPDQVAGQLACGVYNNNARNITWTARRSCCSVMCRAKRTSTRCTDGG